MRIDIIITDEALESLNKNQNISTETGAYVEFLGLIRAQESGDTIQGIVYEAYSSMAEKTMRQILENLQTQYPCHAVEVLHRTGQVNVGQAAICVRVWAAHRQEAFEMCTAFMDRLKAEVPIWKDTFV